MSTLPRSSQHCTIGFLVSLNWCQCRLSDNFIKNLVVICRHRSRCDIVFCGLLQCRVGVEHKFLGVLMVVIVKEELKCFQFPSVIISTNIGHYRKCFVLYHFKIALSSPLCSSCNQIPEPLPHESLVPRPWTPLLALECL